MVAFIITKIYLIGKTILVMAGQIDQIGLVWIFEDFTFWIWGTGLTRPSFSPNIPTIDKVL
jgi:hypothetical protein